MISFSMLIAYLAIPVCILWILRSRLWGKSHRLPLPPGPRPKPFIGNLLDLPKTRLWHTISQWQKIYGGIIHVNILGTNYIFLNDYDAAIDLLDKRSSIYSDRPRLVMLREMIGWKDALPFQQYSAEWRQHRKEFHKALHVNAVPTYRPGETASYRRMIVDILDTPHEFMHHIHETVSRNILRIGYGLNHRDAEPYISLAEDAIEDINRCGESGAFLVEQLPILKYIPSWFPGAEWKRLGIKWRDDTERFASEPFNAALDLIRSNMSRVSMVSQILQGKGDEDRRSEKEYLAKWVAATAYAAGTDTLVVSVQTFFLAMALYPDVQTKAQNEIDTIIGMDRLPETSDRSDLPYIEAVLKEVLRWNPGFPIPAPHAVTQDDEYKGYFIPKGSAIAPNVWHMLHDETIYPEPTVFKPERFLDKEGKPDLSIRQPENVAFGFGRRICPGKHLGMESLFIAVTSALATLDIQPTVDENGLQTPVKPEFIPGLMSCVKPFKCRIQPRCEKRVELIRELVQETSDVF